MKAMDDDLRVVWFLHKNPAWTYQDICDMPAVLAEALMSIPT